MNNTFLLISPEDYLVTFRNRFRDRYTFMESVLRYLEDNDIPHMHCFDSIRVYPIDHYHAREICDHFRITKMRYYIDGKLSKLFEIKKGRENS